jgi:hypothetical protein
MNAILALLVRRPHCVHCPAQPLQFLRKYIVERLQLPITFYGGCQASNSLHHIGLLRAHRERPCRRPGAEKRDELATPHCLPRVWDQRFSALNFHHQNRKSQPAEQGSMTIVCCTSPEQQMSQMGHEAKNSM